MPSGLASLVTNDDIGGRHIIWARMAVVFTAILLVGSVFVAPAEAHGDPCSSTVSAFLSSSGIIKGQTHYSCPSPHYRACAIGELWYRDPWQFLNWRYISSRESCNPNTNVRTAQITINGYACVTGGQVSREFRYTGNGYSLNNNNDYVHTTAKKTAYFYCP